MIEALQVDDKFNMLLKPISPNPIIKDAEFYIHKDGLIINADGYCHPNGCLVGQVLYVPRIHGEKKLFGQEYTKIRFDPDIYEPISYTQVREILQEVNADLDQWHINSLPYNYEQVLALDEFIGYIPGEKAFNQAIRGNLGNPEEILKDLSSLAEILNEDLNKFALGLTGSPALGQIENYHDLDIVFREDIVTNRRIADKMRELVISEPHRRLHEGGKSWLIRFFNMDGIDNGTLMCCFFGYKDVDDAPLKEFSMELHEKDVQLKGSVSDARHALYTPSIVNLQDVKTLKIGNENVEKRLPDDLPLIIYHTASRGELNLGDKVWANGSLVEVITPTLNYLAIVAIEREAVRNETPPWENYYSKPRFSDYDS